MLKLFRERTVRAGLFALAVVGVVACGKDVTGPGDGGPGAGGSSGGGTQSTTASVTFRSTSCTCVVGPIRNYVDGIQVGNMSCNQSATYTVSVGSRELRARDDTGSWGPTTHVFSANERQTWSLTC